jgi:hypothetical protein
VNESFHCSLWFSQLHKILKLKIVKYGYVKSYPKEPATQVWSFKILGLKSCSKVSSVFFEKISYLQEVWNIERKFIFHKSYVEIHIPRPFFDNRKDIWKIVVLKIQMMGCALVPSFHMTIFFLNKIKISNFGGISKLLKLIVSGHIFAVLGRFSYIDSG